MNTTKISIIILSLFSATVMSGQYQWRPRDPLDLDVIDLGDNKVLLYNGLGLGLTYWLDGRAKYEDDNYNNWEIGTTIFNGYRPELDGTMVQLSLRRRILLKKFLSIGIEGRVLSYIDNPNPGLGFSPTFTWIIINKPRLRIAYDNGVGPNIFLNQWPEGGTRLNFSTFYGLKVEVPLDDQWYTMGIYNLHISNADIKGRERNPPFDGVGFFIGVLF